jgi:hypothetical protein
MKKYNDIKIGEIYKTIRGFTFKVISKNDKLASIQGCGNQPCELKNGWSFTRNEYELVAKYIFEHPGCRLCEAEHGRTFSGSYI